MSGYIDKYLHKFQHSSPLRKQNNHHQCRIPQYGSRIKYTLDDDTTSELGKDERTKVQNIVGTMLYYARAVDCTMLITLNTTS